MKKLIVFLLLATAALCYAGPPSYPPGPWTSDGGAVAPVEGEVDIVGESTTSDDPRLYVHDNTTTNGRKIVTLSTSAASGSLSFESPSYDWKWFIGSNGEMRFDSNDGVGKFFISNIGDVSAGNVSPDARFHVEENNAATNSAVELVRTTLTSTGAPAAGLAARHVFEMETSANNNELGAYIQARLTDATATSEDFALDLGLMAAGGAAGTRLSIGSQGMVNFAYETITCSSDAGTANPGIRHHYIVSDGDADTDEDTVSLADGNAGDEVIFTFKTDTDTGDSVNITPSNFANGTKIVFDTEGESCHMLFDGSNWVLISHYGGTVS